MEPEWQQSSIGALIESDLASLQTGPFGTVLKASEYSLSGVPLISVGEIRYGSLAVGPETPRVGREVVHRLPSYVLREGDIVFGRKGAVDRNALVSAEQDGWFLGSDGIRLRLSPQIDAAFISYQLRSSIIQEWLLHHSEGTTMASMNQKILGRLPLILPPLSVQRDIAGVLSVLDSRIHGLMGTASVLENIARAIFKSWFVDLDPVRAKAEGREPESIDVATAAFFTDGFKDSELGKIPRGWRVGSIFEIANLLSGGTPKTDRPQYWDGDVDWASAKDVSQCRQSFLIKTERTITDRGLAESSTKLLPSYSTVIVARGATTGRTALLGHEMAMNQTCYALSSKLDTPFTLYCLIQNLVNQLVHAAHGSVFETITTRTFSGTKLILPPPELLSRFEAFIRPLFMRILANTETVFLLRDLRDTLLPRLISGKLRVPEAEKLVEAVL